MKEEIHGQKLFLVESLFKVSSKFCRDKPISNISKLYKTYVTCKTQHSKYEIKHCEMKLMCVTFVMTRET